MNDIRRGLPSASSMHRYAACPGAWLAEQAMPREEGKSAEASHGTRIHDALAGKLDPQTLNLDEYATWERCKDQADRLIAEHIATERHSWKFICEERLWGFVGLEKAFSGEPDLVVIGEGKALIVDYKTLLGDIEPAAGNIQLRTLAVLVFEHFGVSEVVVAIVQPLAGPPTTAIYTRADLEQAAAEIYGLVEEIKRPGLPRVPSGAACEYCRARGVCPEALAIVTSNPPVGLSVNQIDEVLPLITSDALARILEQSKIAESVIKACRSEAKRRLAAGEQVPGWKLEEGDFPESITDPQAVASRFFALGGTQEAFLGAVKVTKTALKEAVSAVTGTRGKALDQTVRSLCEGATERKQNAASLVKV
jgi:hypothetical protein